MGLQKAIATMNFPDIWIGLGWLQKHETGKRFGGSKMNESIAERVDPRLSHCAEQVDKAIADFQFTVTDITMKYQKKIIQPENQMLLKRIADSTISLYSMAAVLSRASRAVQRSDDSADHEVRMAEAWCKNQCEEIKFWLKQARSNQSFHQTSLPFHEPSSLTKLQFSPIP